MKILMIPHIKDISLDNGLGRVIQKYFEYLPQVGIELVSKNSKKYDLLVSHAGWNLQPDVLHLHGFYWSSYATENHHRQNKNLIEACRNTSFITVPSKWVAETLKRDFRLKPYIIPHAVEFDEWQSNRKSKGYVLWNKNRASDACNPDAVYELAKRNPQQEFVTTFTPHKEPLPNLKICGRLPFAQMKILIQECSIYLATAKETFGIGTLEALACGKPVLGFNWGGTKEIEYKHCKYLVEPYDYDALSEGLQYLLNADLSDNCKETALQYNWLNVANQLREVYKDALEWKYKRN